jgi:nitroreductase
MNEHSRHAAPAPDAPQDALRARYGLESALPSIRQDRAIEALLNHRSVRAYLPDALPLGTLETLVAAAQSASTSSNLQTWSVVAVENKETKARLSALAANQKHIAEAPLLLVWLADLSRLEEIGRSRQAPTEALSYLEMFLTAVIDTALAAQNAVVALESLGLGSVYIGAMRNHPVEVAKLLGLPLNAVAVFGLAVGYPDPARPASVKPRLSQNVVLHRERYETRLPQADIDAYDAEAAAFQRSQGLPETGWTGPVLKRVSGPQSLSGRDKIRVALESLGFGLK